MKKNDVILMCTVLAIAFIVLSLILIFTKQGEVAIVTVDGQEYARLPLDTDTELCVNTENGENLIVVKDGKVYVESASCPDKICVKTGPASQQKTIICVPNKVSVTVE